MSMPTHRTETSVTISLAELARIEEERVKREEADRARDRAERARQVREAEAARRAEEAARLAADDEARARKAREEAVEKARLEAREQARGEIARIEAEAQARLAADNAVRAHELNELRVRRETGRRRREYVLSAALALFACVGGVATYTTAQRHDELARASAELRDREHALARERDDARGTELAALDRRHATLVGRAPKRGAEDARRIADEARRAIAERAPGHERLRRFFDALDALETRVEGLERLEALNGRRTDLAAWAIATRRNDVAEALRRASDTATAPSAGADAIADYEQALNRARDALQRRGGPVLNRNVDDGPRPTRCDPNDPSCGFDGQPVF
jgi:hypothetical protein